MSRKLAAMVGLLVGCGSDSSLDGGRGARACDTGATQACACPGLLIGVQTCRDDGTGWQTCVCGQPGGSGGSAAPIGTGGTPSSGGTGGAPAGTGGICSGTAISVEPVPAVLQILVDVSASTLLAAPNTAETKWNITRNALVGVMGSLPESEWVGVQFFPNQRTDTYYATPQQPHTACVNLADNVDIAPLGAPGSTQRLAIDAAFSGVTPVSGAGAPTLDAYLLAVQQIYDAANLPTDQFMLLITDGQPTYAEWCVGDGAPPVTNPSLQDLTDPIVNQVSVANAAGIRTFVIGSPGSEVGPDTSIDVRPWLSRAARAGGTALPSCSDSGPNFCHFDLTQSQDFASDLGLALQQIAYSVVPCIYDLVAPDGGTIDTRLINVIYTSNQQRYLVVQNQSSTCDVGWHFTDDSKTQIEICGSACDQIKSDPGGQVDLLFGCSPLMIVQ